MSMCDHLQAALAEARQKGNPELAQTIERAIALAGCPPATAKLESGGTGRPPPGP